MLFDSFIVIRSSSEKTRNGEIQTCQRKIATASRILRKGLSLLLMICTLVTLVPTALAVSVGASSTAITDSYPLTFVKLSSETTLFHFANETTPVHGAITDQVKVAAGTVLIMPTANTFTVIDTTVTPNVSNGYACIYYNNIQYDVLATALPTVMTTAEVLSYVTGTLWKASSFESLKTELNLKRNILVYGLQVALQTLGYYSGTLDGSYGAGHSHSRHQVPEGLQNRLWMALLGPDTQKVLLPRGPLRHTRAAAPSWAARPGRCIRWSTSTFASPRPRRLSRRL